MEQALTPPASPPPRNVPWAQRLRAAAVHLGLSALVAALAAWLVFGLWYPMPFREISGGRDLFLIVVTVDVVIGPLITFAVFDRRKPRRELRRDVTIVIVLQLSALAYGLNTVYVARPAMVVLEVYRLRVVVPADLDDGSLEKAPPQWRRLPLWGVGVTAAKPPSDAERLQSIQLALAGIDLGMRPQLWQGAKETSAAMRAAGKPLRELFSKYPDQVQALHQQAAATGRTVDELKYLPVVARRTDWVALIDATTGTIVGYAPFDGF